MKTPKSAPPYPALPGVKAGFLEALLTVFRLNVFGKTVSQNYTLYILTMLNNIV